MKPIRSALFSFILILLFSCGEENIKFTEAQPTEIEADNELRNDFQGRYFCDEDSTFLTISADRVVQAYEDLGFNIRNADVEVNGSGASKANIEIGSDSSKSLKFKLNANEKNDSVTIDGKFQDELFNLKDGDVAKFHKRYYFLNSRNEEGNSFQVRFLRKTSDGLILCRIQSDSVLHFFENEDFVTKKKSDDSEEDLWILQPSRKQLKKLIDRGLFSDVKAYRKF